MTNPRSLHVLLFKPKAVSDSISPVLGLGYLAAAVRDRHKVTIVNGIRERVGPDRFGERLRRLRPDLVGFQVNTQDLAVLPRYLDTVKRVVPGAWVVLGGAHPTAAPASTMALLDGLRGLLIKGEAEEGFPRLVDLLSRANPSRDEATLEGFSEVSGLVWREGDQTRENGITWIKDLDTIPFPAWDLMEPHRFPPSPHAAFYRALPVAPVVASRGCPYPCVYCAGRLTMGSTVRYRSVSNVLEEVRLLQERYGVREIHLVDDNFTYSKDYVLEFCGQVHDLGLRFHWTCPNGVRLNTLDEEVLRAMKSAGCYAVAVGIESGSQRMLDVMRKGLSLSDIASRVALIRREGLTAIGFFVMGFPTETREEMEQTIRFAGQLGLHRANFMLFHPFPGTEAFEWIRQRHERNGVLLTAPSFAEVSYVPEGFSVEELKNLQRKAFLRFYLRPRAFWYLLRDIRSPRHAYHILRRVVRWMRPRR